MLFERRRLAREPPGGRLATARPTARLPAVRCSRSSSAERSGGNAVVVEAEGGPERLASCVATSCALPIAPTVPDADAGDNPPGPGRGS